MNTTRRPRGAPDSTGGQFAPTHRADAAVELPAPVADAPAEDVVAVDPSVPYPGTLMNSINASPEDTDNLGWALIKAGVDAGTDPSGRLMDDWFQTDSPREVAHVATRALLGRDDDQVAELVAGDDCLRPRDSGRRASFMTHELAGAVRWCEDYARSPRGEAAP
ncbi:hypothetical protein ACFT2C_05925 [Promicromonospora sp. NPDC057138]|uniref:hypothetical protein n=1 Tax=Promicromonospora sp. NPDC057138 TaxID=3346031 RepID=UPI003625BB25